MGDLSIEDLVKKKELAVVPVAPQDDGMVQTVSRLNDGISTFNQTLSGLSQLMSNPMIKSKLDSIRGKKEPNQVLGKGGSVAWQDMPSNKQKAKNPKLWAEGIVTFIETKLDDVIKFGGDLKLSECKQQLKTQRTVIVNTLINSESEIKRVFL